MAFWLRCRCRWLLAEWCRHCGERVAAVPCAGSREYVHAKSRKAWCGAAGGSLAEPGGAAPGEGVELARVRRRFAGRWRVHVIAPGYVAVPHGGDEAPLFGLTPDELGWQLAAAEGAW